MLQLLDLITNSFLASIQPFTFTSTFFISSKFSIIFKDVYNSEYCFRYFTQSPFLKLLLSLSLYSLAVYPLFLRPLLFFIPSKFSRVFKDATTRNIASPASLHHQLSCYLIRCHLMPCPDTPSTLISTLFFFIFLPNYQVGLYLFAVTVLLLQLPSFSYLPSILACTGLLFPAYILPLRSSPFLLFLILLSNYQAYRFTDPVILLQLRSIIIYNSYTFFRWPLIPCLYPPFTFFFPFIPVFSFKLLSISIHWSSYITSGTFLYHLLFLFLLSLIFYSLHISFAFACNFFF